MPIRTPEELRAHLELAICIELSTVPPYLYAMYSFTDPGSDPALLIRSIVVEEMLHAALATNLLLAVGGKPDFRGGRYMPAYPMELPHHRPPLTLNLEPVSTKLLKEVFMRVEQPAAHDAPAEPDQFETLSQFYHALENGIEELSEMHDLFAEPQIESQLSEASFYQPVVFDAEDSGGLVGVTDMASAIAAIEIIVHQGEGLSDDRWADPDHKELTHYHKLLQMVEGGQGLGDIHQLPLNPRSAQYPKDIKVVADLFNAIHHGVYLVMDRIFRPDTNQARAVGVLYLIMGDLLAQIARFLVSQDLSTGMSAAPTFEMYEFGSDTPLDEIKSLSADSARLFPELNPVHEAIRGLSLIL